MTDFEKVLFSLRDMSDNAHLCCFCVHAPEDIEMTTMDVNSCLLFVETIDGYSGVRYISCSESGNTRRYTDGTQTEDNGGGYWVTSCPRFEKRDEGQLYRSYMESEEWEYRRQHKLKEAGYQCQMCGSAINLQVHHITYEHLGYELPGDLLVVCKTCHEKLHRKDLS